MYKIITVAGNTIVDTRTFASKIAMRRFLLSGKK